MCTLGNVNLLVFYVFCFCLIHLLGMIAVEYNYLIGIIPVAIPAAMRCYLAGFATSVGCRYYSELLFPYMYMYNCLVGNS